MGDKMLAASVAGIEVDCLPGTGKMMMTWNTVKVTHYYAAGKEYKICQQYNSFVLPIIYIII